MAADLAGRSGLSLAVCQFKGNENTLNTVTGSIEYSNITSELLLPDTLNKHKSLYVNKDITFCCTVACPGCGCPAFCWGAAAT